MRWPAGELVRRLSTFPTDGAVGERARAASMGERPRVPHKTRAPLASRFPVHVTVRVREGLPSLRCAGEHRVLTGAFRESCERGGFPLVHYAILSNHIHLVCEAKDRESLSRGIQGLCVRIARRLNRLWKRLGKVFGDRFTRASRPNYEGQCIREIVSKARGSEIGRVVLTDLNVYGLAWGEYRIRASMDQLVEVPLEHAAVACAPRASQSVRRLDRGRVAFQS